MIDRAGDEFAAELGRLGVEADDGALDFTETIRYDRLPHFEAAFFASACAVEAFEEQWGVAALRGKMVAASGGPAVEALGARGISADASGMESTIDSGLHGLASLCVAQSLWAKRSDDPIFDGFR